MRRMGLMGLIVKELIRHEGAQRLRQRAVSPGSKVQRPQGGLVHDFAAGFGCQMENLHQVV